MMRSTLNGESLNMDAASLQLIPSPNIQTGITGWYGSWEVGDCRRWISGRYSVCFFWGDGTELIGQDYRDLPIYSPPGLESYVSGHDYVSPGVYTATLFVIHQNYSYISGRCDTVITIT